jgi:Tfp pilus assembly protein PilN
MRAVNLLPAKERGRSFQLTRTQIAVIGAVAVAGGLGYWGYSTHADASSAQADLAAARTQRDQVEAELQKRSADGAGAVSLATGDAFVAGASLGRVDGERLLRRVATVTPPSVWYGDIVLDDSAASAASAAPAAAGASPTTAATLSLDGFTSSHTQVARLMARVSGVPGLGEPHLLSSKVELKSGRNVIHFTILTPLETSTTTVPTGATTP